MNSAQPVSPRLKLGAVLSAVTVAVLAGALFFWSTAYRSAPQQEPVILATGLPGGVYHELGEALEQLTQDSDVPLIARHSAASRVNLNLIAEGEVDAGFTTSDVAGLAVAGEAPFDQPLPIRAIAKVYDQHTHLVVLENSGYERLTDLASSTVSLGAHGSGTRLLSQRLLEVAELADGEDLETLSMDLIDSVHALEEGDIDAFFWSGGLPTKAVSQLAERTPIRLIDLSEWVGPLAELRGGFYEEVPVPVDAYPGIPGVRTIGVSSLLVIRADLPRKTVESLTTDLFTSRIHLAEVHPVIRQLDERSAIATHPVTLHPGAVDYYHGAKVAHRPSQQDQ